MKSSTPEGEVEGGQLNFARLYGAFRKPIQKYVFGKVGNESEAEEVTQEIFLKVFRFRWTYCPEKSFSTWLWTIARNTVFDWLRKNREVSETRISLEAPEQIEEIVDVRPGVETRLVEQTERRRLEHLLHTLTDLQRKALVMRLVQHLSYHEISKALNLSLSSVKSLIFRARESLARTAGKRPGIFRDRSEIPLIDILSK